MGRFVDSIIAYRILRLLTTPFEETDAFRLGIIDKNGKELKKMNALNTVEERDSYSILHRMVFRLKRIIEKVPVENKKLVSFAAALSLIKEQYSKNYEPINLEELYLNKLKKDLTEEINEINKINKQTMFTFKQYTEEAPANNAAATPGIAGFTPDTLGVKVKPKLLKRKKYVSMVS